MSNESHSDLSSRIASVREKIAKAAHLAGRDAREVCLLAVSKTKSAELIQTAAQAGQIDFGENYVQEALKKIDVLPSLRWHLIGSLQTNKVKQVVGKFELIHTLDRIKLITELARAAQATGVIQKVLLQINLGDEASKQGAHLNDGPRLIEEILSHSSLQLKGLMALPPLTEDELSARRMFARLRDCLESWKKLMSPEAAKLFCELSMGTSSDFEWAVLEGATIVRVGTSIFGQRV